MIKRLEHVGLCVSDLDRSVAFYTELLGLKVIRILDCTPDMGLGEVTELPGCSARIAHLDCGGNMLELFEYRQPRSMGSAKDRSQSHVGFSHAGFHCDDVRADYERLKALGVDFLSRPVEFRPGIWIVYFHGPDGEVCELRQT